MITTVRKKFGENVRKARKEKDLSQEELANKAEIERSYMGAIERGERNLSFDKIFKICRALHVKSSEIIPF